MIGIRPFVRGMTCCRCSADANPGKAPLRTKQARVWYFRRLLIASVVAAGLLLRLRRIPENL
jgi:hypothetical protein